MWIMVSTGVSATATVPIYRPSRRMVARSPMRLISSNRWEMYTMPTPRAFKSAMMPNSASISLSVSDEVGSSKIITLEFWLTHLAISTICCCATLRVLSTALGSRSTPRRFSTSPASENKRFHARMPPLFGSRPRKIFSATVRYGTRFSS